MKYRYYINDVEVFPKGEWSIEYQRNEGQIFFRRIFEGELTFGDADYDLITELSCEIATFDIYCGGTVFWQGQFQYPYKIKFDDDSCVVVLTPEVVDEYSCIMDGYGKELILTPSTAGIFAQLWSCPAAGVHLHTFTNRCYPLIGNGAATGDWFSIMLFWISTLNCSGFSIASSFMLRDNFANGDNYAAAYGTNNYITGATNRLEYVYLLENTDIRFNFGGTRCDTPISYTFKMFEDLLRNAFNAYWFIDENGDFRVEHIYYFDPAFPNSDYTIGHDLNTVMDRGGRSFAYRRNKYEYETGRMYDQEKWSWQHYEGTEALQAHGQDFEGVPIFYGAAVNQKSDYVPGDFKEKEHGSQLFWADIDWSYNAWATFASLDFLNCPTGFCMLDIVVGGSNKINCEIGILSGASQVNGHLSTANLQDHYHRYDRVFKQGDMNSGGVIFHTAQKHKLQEPIEFPLCCDEAFNPLNRIRTGLGDGEIKAAVQKKQSLEVELWHEFDCTELGYCPLPSGAMCFDGASSYILLNSTPAITGDQIIEFCCLIPPGGDYTANFDTLIAFQNSTSADRFIVHLLDLGAGSTPLMNICVSSNSGNNQRFSIIPYINTLMHVKVDKGAQSINSIEINGVAVVGVSGSVMTANNSMHFGRSALAPMGFYEGLVWEIIVQGIGYWKGQPAGDTNPAWVDQIGANNGTVNFAAGTYPCW